MAVEGFSQVAGPSRGGHGREADLIGRGERGAGLRRELVGEEEAKLEEEVMDIISLSSYVIRRHPCVVPSFPCHPSIPMSCKSHSIILKSFKAHYINPSSSFVILKSSRHFIVILNHPIPSMHCPVIPVSLQHSSVIQKLFHHPQVISSPSHHSILIPCHPLSFRSHPVISLSSLIIPCHPCIVPSFPCHPSIPVSFKSRSSILLESFRAHHIIPS